jgi:ABC-type transport system involved in cytochrome c biogenesis permease subunit
MNNPIRYRGETFYQSTYNKDRRTNLESTGLQVVENAGWVIPYVTCMMVLVGMLAHFGGTFLVFAGRYDRGIAKANALATNLDSNDQAANPALSTAKSHSKSTTVPATSIWSKIGPALIGIALVAIVAGYYAKPNRVGVSETDWNAIGQLPMQHEGRIKPMDTVAKNVLQVLTEPVFGGTPYVKDAADKKHTPTEWLMGVMTNEEWVEKAPVFRIYSQEVRDLFELQPRSGFRYSYDELRPKRGKFSEAMNPIREKQDGEELTPIEQKYAAMSSKLNLFDLISFSYQLPNIPDVSKAGESEEARQKFSQALMQALDTIQRLEAGNPPGIIPPVHVDKEVPNSDKWQAYGPSFFAAYVQNLVSPEKVEPNPAILAFTDILDATRKGSSAEINKAVNNYKKTIEKIPAAQSRMAKARAEVWLNKFNPTGQAIVFYLLAIVMGFASLMTGWDNLRRATFWMLVATLVIHTIAIASRIYISGRPPVINLYSSAVFIGWATAILGLLLESLFPIGVSNLAVALIGAITLSVARSLDNTDTMHVLQAILDTQFWLSTHVVTVTYGYAATYLAGFLGIMALVHRMAMGGRMGTQQKNFQDVLYRMSYGVVCFGLFLSFIGTVLGGLWADDSWGRFWGWDPKENGALMIVLWNAIVLHARWDKMVGQRGFALLTVVGNIITTWSWFGVNQLGVGLHSYGNNSSVLAVLLGTVSLHVAFIAVAYAMTRHKDEFQPTAR